MVTKLALSCGVALAAFASTVCAQTQSRPASGEDVSAPAHQARTKSARGETNLEGVVVRAPRKVGLPLLTEPIVETPQTITIITQEDILLADRNDLRDVLRFDPSVSEHADEDSGQGTNVQIRGFSARPDLYRDGQLDIGRYYRDPFDLETVEVLTGPSSVLFGRGSTGGAINEVSKAPTLDPHRGVALSGGTDDMGRITADVDTPLSSTIAFRINGMGYTTGIAGRDQVYNRRFGISPVIGFGLGTPTEVVIGLTHQSEWNRPDYGVPWIDIGQPGDVSHPAAVPWRNYYGFADDYERAEANIATIAVKHDLSANWTFHDQFRYAWYTRSYRITEPGIGPIIAPDTPLSSLTITRTMRGLYSTERFLEDQADVSGRFKLWGVTHKLVIGGEIGRQTSDPTTLSYSGVPGTNLVTPDETALFSGVSSPKSVVKFTADTAAAYIGDTLEFGHLFELEGVARVDQFDATYINTLPNPPVVLPAPDVEGSYRAALVYKPARDARVYVMWGTSFDPSAENQSLSVSTADLAPEREHTLEAGAKWDLNRSVLLSADLFQTVQDNYREADPLDPLVDLIAGTARSRGFELLAQGRITPRWLVLSGYTYMVAKIIASPNDDLGRPLQDAPRNSVRLFSTYDITDRLTAGGGLNYSSSRVPSSLPDPNGFWQQVPGYTTVSLLARYQLRSNLSLQVNVDNLFGEHFYDGTDDNHVNVGAGRSIHFTLAFRQ